MKISLLYITVFVAVMWHDIGRF